VSCDEDVPASLADVSALDSRRNLKPGRQKSLQVPGHLLGCCGGRSSKRAHPSGRATEFFGGRSGLHHSWRRALTQCRARYHILIHPRGWPTRCKFVPFGTGIGLCQPFGWQTLAGLYPGLPFGEWTLLLAWSGFAGTDLPNAAALTLRVDLAARLHFRTFERLISPTHRTFDPWLATASMVSR
jgi:hypothetical protein